MKRIAYLLFAVVALTSVIVYVAHATGDADVKAAPTFDIKIPLGYRDWKLISVAHEAGNNNDLRAVLGNDAAINASREGTLPSRMAQSSPGWRGATSPPRKTTKSSAGTSLS